MFLSLSRYRSASQMLARVNVPACQGIVRACQAIVRACQAIVRACQAIVRACQAIVRNFIFYLRVD